MNVFIVEQLVQTPQRFTNIHPKVTKMTLQSRNMADLCVGCIVICVSPASQKEESLHQ